METHSLGRLLLDHLLDLVLLDDLECLVDEEHEAEAEYD